MPAFPVVPARTALLFFDALNIYLHSEELEGRAEQAPGTIPRGDADAIAASTIIFQMVRLREASRAAGIPIFYSQADHRPDGRDFGPHIVDDQPWFPGDGPRVTRPPAVKAGSWGADVIRELPVEPADYLIKKHRWSAFHQTHFELSLRTAGIDTIILCGGAIEIGVASTAYSARDHDYNLIVVRDACTAINADVGEVYMDRVFPMFARVMTVDQLLGQIEQ